MTRHPILFRATLIYLGLLASVYVILGLLLVGDALGDRTPEFPFQNTQQLGPGIPGMMPYGEPEIATCPDGTPLVVFSFGRYTQIEGAHGWQVWVELKGSHFTGAFFEGGTTPKAVYMGMVNEANGHMTLQRSEPFDPKRHHTPCDEWK